MTEKARQTIETPGQAAEPPVAASSDARASGAKASSKSAVERPDYLDIVYSKERRPPTDYPRRLARYLAEVHAPSGGRLLDLGCGRGDMLRAFDAAEFDVAGVDISPDVTSHCQPLEAHCVDLVNAPLPFAPGSFDVVFSKSVIEHLHDPMPFLGTALEALKPGGTAIIMTPSWIHHGWGPFYLDHTHVTPFTAPSLHDAMSIAGFDQIDVTHFRQLPFLWRWPILNVPVALFSKLPLRYSPMHGQRKRWPNGIDNFIRFSKEAMLLACARKPRA